MLYRHCFSFCFRICRQESQGNEASLELNGTHQLLVYVDNVNSLGDSVNTIKQKKETLLQANKDIGLEINAEKTKYTILSHHQD
jgi:hypothetical protein